MQTPVANNHNTGIGTTGTINPGVVWVGDGFQVAMEAMVPINRQSGSGVGGMVQLHLYLDDTLMQCRTSFIIAHRLSTIRDADWILVMNNGDIVERASTRNCWRKKASMPSFTTASLKEKKSNLKSPFPRKHGHQLRISPEEVDALVNVFLNGIKYKENLKLG